MMASPARQVKVNSVSLISAKLLEGWTMLADGCPECQVRPALRPPHHPAMRAYCLIDVLRARAGAVAAPARHGYRRAVREL